MSTWRGAPLIRIRLDVPPSGGWIAVAALASGPVPELGAGALVVGDLTLIGKATRADEDSPDQPVVVIAGGAGWEAPLGRKGAYGASGGVRLSTVLADLCRLAGEPYDAPADVSLGDTYGWPASTARLPISGRTVLADLVSRGAIPAWRVDPPSGRTRFDAWPSLGSADKIARVLHRNMARGARRIGLDGSVAALLPGSSIEGAQTRRLTVFDAAGAMTAEVREQ